ncbi:hypothetical protein GW750_00165 [bacterium]|nr:hypothetical protein [bacterium]
MVVRVYADAYVTKHSVATKHSVNNFFIIIRVIIKSYGVGSIFLVEYVSKTDSSIFFDVLS